MDAFTRFSIATALRSSMDNADDRDGEPLDSTTAPTTRPRNARHLHDSLRVIQRGYAADTGDRQQRAGHDFRLTRCGHGPGFGKAYGPTGSGSAPPMRPPPTAALTCTSATTG